MRRIVIGFLVLVACGDSLPAQPDAAVSPDAAVLAAPVITTFTAYPGVVIDGCAAPGGGMFPNWPVAIDDCVECMCSTFGGRCQRRASCARDVCVLVDGTTVARGESAAVGCHDCTCAADGPVCTRRTAAPCPADGCLLPRGGTIAAGEKRFVSECHVCTCDAERGLECENVCHPFCYCTDGDGADGCAALCGDTPCAAEIPAAGLEVPDQALLSIGCAACVCDYGDLNCDPAACP